MDSDSGCNDVGHSVGRKSAIHVNWMQGPGRGLRHVEPLASACRIFDMDSSTSWTSPVSGLPWWCNRTNQGRRLEKLLRFGIETGSGRLCVRAAFTPASLGAASDLGLWDFGLIAIGL